ncbi:hypothetical protein [Maribacter sp. 2308TA10-17]|uniref:hypothetical protein n=1 Tax=Maribacter sp. 2308TA10-17 TaxID=3386276 RepID=UPI0039BD4DDF
MNDERRGEKYEPYCHFEPFDWLKINSVENLGTPIGLDGACAESSRGARPDNFIEN